jgi:hypothetical protein
LYEVLHATACAKYKFGEFSKEFLEEGHLGSWSCDSGGVCGNVKAELASRLGHINFSQSRRRKKSNFCTLHPRTMAIKGMARTEPGNDLIPVLLCTDYMWALVLW